MTLRSTASRSKSVQSIQNVLSTDCHNIGDSIVGARAVALRGAFMEHIEGWVHDAADAGEAMNLLVTELESDRFALQINRINGPWSAEAIYRRSDLVVALEMQRPNTIRISISGQSFESAKELNDKLLALIPREQVPERLDLVPIRFWRWSCGARYNDRVLRCPSLDELAENYPSIVRAELNRLASIEKPESKGRVILWHGPPGTGKTYAVRGLARDWFRRLKASIEVIVDAEALFGNSDYLYEILLNNQGYAHDSVQDDDSDTPPAQLRLIIMEDSANFFADDCRKTPGFSRLLNMTDGLIGQGTRFLFLFTANEALQRIDPALLRPGRCSSLAEFPCFPAAEAKRWLESRAPEQATAFEERSMSLAELFALVGDEEAPAPETTKSKRKKSKRKKSNSQKSKVKNKKALQTSSVGSG